MPSLAEAIKAKLASSGVSATAAARAAGLSLPSFRAALKGKSSPNARSVKKYGKLLGISEAEVLALVGSSSKGKKAAKPAKMGKAKAAGKKRGPKPGKKRGPKPGKKRGPKPGKKRGPKPGRRAGRPAGGIGPIVALLKQAEALIGDDLAMAVHGLGKSQRGTIAAIVASLS